MTLIKVTVTGPPPLQFKTVPRSEWAIFKGGLCWEVQTPMYCGHTRYVFLGRTFDECLWIMREWVRRAPSKRAVSTNYKAYLRAGEVQREIVAERMSA